MTASSHRRLRQFHLWLGLFFAPSIIFFALSGTLQSLGFQDRSASYVPPAWIDLAANVHKHGRARRSPPRRPPAAAAPAARPARSFEPQSKFPGLFNLFACALGLLLAASTVLGIWIAFLNPRERRTSAILLLAGLIVPVLLLAL